MRRALALTAGIVLLSGGLFFGWLGTCVPMPELEPTPIGGTETLRLLLAVAGASSIFSGAVALASSLRSVR